MPTVRLLFNDDIVVDEVLSNIPVTRLRTWNRHRTAVCFIILNPFCFFYLLSILDSILWLVFSLQTYLTLNLSSQLAIPSHWFRVKRGAAIGIVRATSLIIEGLTLIQIGRRWIKLKWHYLSNNAFTALCHCRISLGCSNTRVHCTWLPSNSYPTRQGETPPETRPASRRSSGLS